MGGHFYILIYFSISVYVSNCIIRNIYDNSGMFFTLTFVNFVLYYMLILIHQQYFEVDGAILYILLQMFLHITILWIFFFYHSFFVN